MDKNVHRMLSFCRKQEGNLGTYTYIKKQWKDNSKINKYMEGGQQVGETKILMKIL